MTIGRRLGLFALLMVSMAMAYPAPALAADPAEQRMIRLEVTIGRSQVVDLKEPFTRVSVTNPAVADVFVVSPNQILVNGKAVGVTSLVVFYPERTMFFDVVVHTDVELRPLRGREEHAPDLRPLGRCRGHGRRQQAGDQAMQLRITNHESPFTVCAAPWKPRPWR